MRGRRPATTISTAQSFSSLPRRRVSSAGELLTALQRSKRTVTDFLEHLAGELIDADILFPEDRNRWQRQLARTRI